MKSLHLAIIAISCISLVVILPHVFAETESASSINETQFQLKVNQTTSLESDNIKVKFLNVTEDSRCPSGVTCVWQGQVKIFVNILENNQDLGDFSLTSRAGENSLAIQVFDGHSIELIAVDPYPTNGKKTSLFDYVSTFAISKSGVLSPLKQFKAGVATKDVTCKEGLQIIIKSNDGSPVCVKPQTAQKLVERGWAIKFQSTPQENGTLVVLSEGQREGPLLVQKILPDSIQGLDFREYPLATNVGYPITLHIGDSASNGCTVELTLVKISGSTATFLKKEYQNRPCPICLSENTVIDTPNGPVNVKELRVGMTVLTQDSSGHKQTAIILKTGRTLAPPDHKMVHLILDDKRELYVSPNHPTSDGRLFGELFVGDILDGSKIKSLQRVSYNGTSTYDILPSGQTGLYWANGILTKSTLK